MTSIGSKLALTDGKSATAKRLKLPLETKN
jgi:hypothetical protein